MYFCMSTHKQARKHAKLLTGQPLGRRAGESLHVHTVRPVLSAFIVLHPLFIGTGTRRLWYQEGVPGTIPVLRGDLS